MKYSTADKLVRSYNSDYQIEDSFRNQNDANWFLVHFTDDNMYRLIDKDNNLSSLVSRLDKKNRKITDDIDDRYL